MKAAEPSEAAIRTMVHQFYDRVWGDSTLGPIFQARLDHKRQAHLDRMCDFWSSILLGSRRFVGNPMEAHRNISGISGAHFDRWLELFRATVDEVFEPPAANNVFLRATHMRIALERGSVGYTDPAPHDSSPQAQHEPSETDPEESSEPPGC